MNDSVSSMDTVRVALEQAMEWSARKQDEEALRFNRQALKAAMGVFQKEGKGEALHLALIAYRGVAVSAFLTGRQAEGAMALATGLASATLGLRHWPDAPPLLDEQERLMTLEKKTAGDGAVYISDDLSQWPFDD